MALPILPVPAIPIFKRAPQIAMKKFYYAAVSTDPCFRAGCVMLFHIAWSA